MLLVGAVVVSNAVAGADMTALEVIKKSEAAYAALKTYVGTTTVRSETTVDTTPMQQISSAKVTYMRPGKVHIQGKTASAPMAKDGSPFTIISDGKTTWSSWARQNNGAFKKVDGVAAAGMAGVALGAAEAMPSALMKSDGVFTGGGDPLLIPRLAGAAHQGHEKIEGSDCYKIVSKSPTLGDATMWIDSSTFLIRQMKRDYSERQLSDMRASAEASLKKAGRDLPLPANVPVLKGMSQVFSFKNEAMNAKVDEKLFADPTNK
jgi:hypothetical protein